MNELLNINYNNDRITVSARELYEFLEIGTDVYKRQVQEQAGTQLIEEFQATLDKGLKLGLTLPQIQTLFDQAQKTVIQEKREKS